MGVETGETLKLQSQLAWGPRQQAVMRRDTVSNKADRTWGCPRTSTRASQSYSEKVSSHVPKEPSFPPHLKTAKPSLSLTLSLGLPKHWLNFSETWNFIPREAGPLCSWSQDLFSEVPRRSYYTTTPWDQCTLQDLAFLQRTWHFLTCDTIFMTSAGQAACPCWISNICIW